MPEREEEVLQLRLRLSLRCERTSCPSCGADHEIPLHEIHRRRARRLDLEDLVSKLSDLLLSSGFGNPYGMDDEERTMQALHDAILDALFNGGVLPEETLEQLLGDPADGDQDGRAVEARGADPADHRADDATRATSPTPPDLEAERERRQGRGGGHGPDEPPTSRSRSPTRRSISSATARSATCSARSARAATAVTTRASRRPASKRPARRSRTSSATR